MGSPFIMEYRSEGGPMLVADLPAATQWTGMDDDGSGVTVEYMNDPVDALPAEYQLVKKGGMQRKKFRTLPEAHEFQKKLLPILLKLHRKLDDRPTFPSPTGSYIGETDGERVFSIECIYASLYSVVLEKLGDGATVVPFDKKKKTKGVFFEQADAGPGIIVVDADRNTVVIAKPHDGSVMKKGIEAVGREVAALADPKARAKAQGKATGKLELDGHIVVFPAALSHRLIVTGSGKGATLADAAPLFDGKAASGPLRIPEQKAPGGAYASLKAGQYTAYYYYDVDVAGGAAVMWLSL